MSHAGALAQIVNGNLLVGRTREEVNSGVDYRFARVPARLARPMSGRARISGSTALLRGSCGHSSRPILAGHGRTPDSATTLWCRGPRCHLVSASGALGYSLATIRLVWGSAGP
jgi:hypothetical protein